MSGSRDHRVRVLTEGVFEVQWTTDRKLPYTKATRGVVSFRIVDAAGVRRFGKKWNVPIPDEARESS